MYQAILRNIETLFSYRNETNARINYIGTRMSIMDEFLQKALSAKDFRNYKAKVKVLNYDMAKVYSELEKTRAKATVTAHGAAGNHTAAGNSNNSF